MTESRTQMEVLIWIVILMLFVLSFAALFYPVLPSVTAVWAGFLLYHFLIERIESTFFFWIPMIILTLILLLADVLASSLSVRKFGGSKQGERAATIGVIVGSFIFPPFGIFIVPFILVLLIELFQKNAFKAALKSSFGSLVGFLSGQFAEFVIQVVMIIWFFMAIWF